MAEESPPFIPPNIYLDPNLDNRTQDPTITSTKKPAPTGTPPTSVFVSDPPNGGKITNMSNNWLISNSDIETQDFNTSLINAYNNYSASINLPNNGVSESTPSTQVEAGPNSTTVSSQNSSAQPSKYSNENADENQQAVLDFAERWNIAPEAAFGVLNIETNGIDPTAQGGDESNYHGIFQLKGSEVAGLSEKAGFGKLSPEEYRKLSVKDQLLVMDQYYKQYGITPEFFTGDPSRDAARMWELQLSPSDARARAINGDLDNPDYVIDTNPQAGIITDNGVVTVASASGGSLKSAKNYQTEHDFDIAATDRNASSVARDTLPSLEEQDKINERMQNALDEWNEQANMSGSGQPILTDPEQLPSQMREKIEQEVMDESDAASGQTYAAPSSDPTAQETLNQAIRDEDIKTGIIGTPDAIPTAEVNEPPPATPPQLPVEVGPLAVGPEPMPEPGTSVIYPGAPGTDKASILANLPEPQTPITQTVNEKVKSEEVGRSPLEEIAARQIKNRIGEQDVFNKNQTQVTNAQVKNSMNQEQNSLNLTDITDTQTVPNSLKKAITEATMNDNLDDFGLSPRTTYRK